MVRQLPGCLIADVHVPPGQPARRAGVEPALRSHVRRRGTTCQRVFMGIDLQPNCKYSLGGGRLNCPKTFLPVP